MNTENFRIAPRLTRPLKKCISREVLSFSARSSSSFLSMCFLFYIFHLAKCRSFFFTLTMCFVALRLILSSCFALYRDDVDESTSHPDVD